MSWWQKIRGLGSKHIESHSTFPFNVELVAGKLRARVFVHELESREGRVPCWSYVSDGLRAHGQKELIFTLRRRPGEKEKEIPVPPLEFFQTVYRLAEQGRLVDAGEFTEFGPSGFLNRTDFRGVGYVRAQYLEGVESPSTPALQAVALLCEEMETAKLYGVTRVTALLGLAYRYYPCPPWYDPDRGCLVSLAAMQKSLLSLFTRFCLPGASVRREMSGIILRLPSGAHSLVEQRIQPLPANAPVAFLTQVDSGADACLVWNPSEQGAGPAAITPPESDGLRLAGCFVAFLPEQPEDGGLIVEDGFVMHLTDLSWNKVRKALTSGATISVPAGPGQDRFGFWLKWVEQTYEIQ